MSITKSLLFLTCAAILASGCVSNNKVSEEKPSAKDKVLTDSSARNAVVCTYEKKLGKLIKEKVCYSKRDREIIKENAEEFKREKKSKRI